MTFTPIVSLLEGVPGLRHLTRAIELYLECEFVSKNLTSLYLNPPGYILIEISRYFYQISLLLKIYNTSWITK